MTGGTSLRMSSYNFAMARLAPCLWAVALLVTAPGSNAEDIQAQMRRQQLSNLSINLRKAIDRKGLGEYFKATQQLEQADARASAHAAVVVGLYYLGDRAAAGRLHRQLNATPEGSRFSSLLAADNLSSPCRTCNGKGSAEHKCKACKGNGKCGNAQCKNGTITVPTFEGTKQKQCPVCRGNLKCGECKGEGNVSGRCGKCLGRGHQRSQKRELAVFRDLLDRAEKQVMATATVAVTAPTQPTATKPDSGKDPNSPWIVEPDASPKRPPVEFSANDLSPEALMKSTGADKLVNLNGIQAEMKTPVSEFAMWLANQQRGAAPWATNVTGQLSEGLPQLELKISPAFERFPKGERDRLCEGVHRYWEACCTRNKIAARAAPVRFVKADGSVVRVER